MTIKNKDGTIYKLRGPNPLLEKQSEWDKNATKLINLGSKRSEIVEDERNPVEEQKKNVINIREELKLQDNPKVIRAKEFIEEITAAPEKIETPVVQTIPQMPPPSTKVLDTIEINVDPKLARILKEHGVEFFCAPVVGVKKHVDSLYGTSYETMTYGDQFLFDAVLIDESDLQIQFWCIRPIAKNSVVLRKVAEGGERWWRVNSVEEKTGGYLVLCVISDSNPDFS